MFASLHTSALTLDRVNKRSGSGVFMRLIAAFELSVQRRRLAALDDHMLADIGLSREEARREASRPVWDAPAHWLR